MPDSHRMKSVLATWPLLGMFVLLYLASPAWGQGPDINQRFPIREKSNLSPPIVVPPIHDCALAVRVTGFVPGAVVRVFANGLDVGAAKPTDDPADIKLKKAVGLGDAITATQTVGSVTTDPSYDSVIVSAYPAMTTPVVEPKIYECGRVVPVGNLIASTHVEVSDITPATPAVLGTAETTTAWEPVVTGPKLQVNHRIRAQQTACPATPQEVKSAFSTPALKVTAAPNPPPVTAVDLPVVGATKLVIHNLLVGAEVSVSYDGTPHDAGLATAADNSADVPPVPPGQKVTTTQTLCTSSDPSPPVVPTTKPNTPILGSPICSGSHYVMIDKTVPSAIVVLLRGGSVIGYGGGVLGTLKLAVGSGVTLNEGDQLTVVQYVSSSFGTFLSDPSNMVTVNCGGGSNVVTQHNDNQRTGVYDAENILTPSAVLSRGMRIRYVHNVDGWINTQPLYVGRVEFQQGAANGLFFGAVFTNKMYALNADTGDEEWVTVLADSDPAKRGLAGGIDSTPVIDVPNHRLYVVFDTKNQQLDAADQPNSLKPPNDGKAHTYEDTDLKNLDLAYWLVALDDRTGQEVARTLISASMYRGNGAPLPFEANFHRQHPALLLDHGVVYVAFGSIAGSEGFLEYHGWVMAYRAFDLAFQSSFNTSPNWAPPRHPYAPQNPYNPSGIWQGGGGLAADQDGNVFLLVGNGGTDIDHGNYGDTFLKLTNTGSALVPTAFVPSDAAAMAKNDADLGGGGTMAIPGTNLVIGGGKPGYMYLMERGSMNLRQQLTASTNHYDPSMRDGTWNLGPHLHGSPTYWRGPDRTFGNLYVWGEKDHLRLYHFDPAAGKVVVPEARNAPVVALLDTMPGGMLSISANGNHAGTGIVWASLPTSITPNPYPGRLYAFNAETLQPLWDTAFPSVGHWLLPTVAAGKVFMGTSSRQIICYELGPENGQNTSWKPYQPHDVASSSATMAMQGKNAGVMTILPRNTLRALAPPAKFSRVATFDASGHANFSAAKGTYKSPRAWVFQSTTLEGTVTPAQGQPETTKVTIYPAGLSREKWEATDGSTAEIRRIRSFTAPANDGVPWELYQVMRSGGSGILNGVSYIQRVFTQGGQTPPSALRSQASTAAIPIEAEFILYAAHTP
jgi:outer membrane protein assembly factor BamB